MPIPKDFISMSPWLAERQEKMGLSDAPYKYVGKVVEILVPGNFYWVGTISGYSVEADGQKAFSLIGPTVVSVYKDSDKEHLVIPIQLVWVVQKWALNCRNREEFEQFECEVKFLS
jgi:hypothetical protein